MIKTCVLVLVHVLECYDGYAICACVCTSCDTGHLCALLSDVVSMFVSNLSRVWCNISRGEKMKTMLLVVASSGLSLSLSLPPSLPLSLSVCCAQVEKALDERKNEVETLRQQVCTCMCGIVPPWPAGSK